MLAAAAVILSTQARADVSLLNPGYLGGDDTLVTGVIADGSLIFGSAEVAGGGRHAFYWSNGTIHDLGTLGGTQSSVQAASADGTYLAGTSFVAGDTARHIVLWHGGTMQDLGTLGGNNGVVVAMSAAGDIIAGSSLIAGNANTHAFRWESGVMQDLGTLGGDNSSARSMSSDGAVIVGSSLIAGNAITRAFRWTAADGMEDLGTFGGTSSSAIAVSADGNIIIGAAANGAGSSHAFRWESGTMQDLGTLGGANSTALALSSDGGVVVGSANIASGANHSFRWESGTMQDLGTLGGTTSNAFRVSAAGDVIVGAAQTTGNARNLWYKWTAADGMKSLEGILTDAGVDFTGWQLIAEKDQIYLSADGNTITGLGVLSGVSTSFIMTDTGLTTPDELVQSMTPVAAASQQVQGMVAQGLSQSLLVARNALPIYFPDTAPAKMTVATDAQSLGALEPAAGGPDLAEKLRRRRAVYAIGNFGIGQDTNFSNNVVNGTSGALFELANDMVIGFGVTGSDNEQETRLGGSSRSKAFGGAMLGSFEPPNGWRLYGSLTAATLDIVTERHYVNGAALDSSRGETEGMGYGMAVRAGREYPVSDKTRVMPYVEGEWSHSNINGYTETGGGLPATVADSRGTTVTSRAGVEVSHDVTHDVTFRGRAAWGHRYSGNSSVVVNVASVAQAVSAQDADKDWAEAAAGFNYRLSKKTAVSAEISGHSGRTSEPSVSVTVNFVWALN